MPMTYAMPKTRPRRGRLNGALWRIRQFAHTLQSKSDPAVDAQLQRLLASDEQWELMSRLTPFDRAHHLRVYTLLVSSGHDNPDLLRASLLHDVGKADERGRVTPLHRAAHVLLGWLAPGLLVRLADDSGWFRHGLWLSLRHAEVGAALAAGAGASERCCALIASHADQDTHADPLLLALITADNAAIR